MIELIAVGALIDGLKLAYTTTFINMQFCKSKKVYSFTFCLNDKIWIPILSGHKGRLRTGIFTSVANGILTFLPNVSLRVMMSTAAKSIMHAKSCTNF